MLDPACVDDKQRSPAFLFVAQAFLFLWRIMAA